MIRREKGRFMLTCDSCGQFIGDAKWRPYKIAWEEAKAKGWNARPIANGKDWAHDCPQCVKHSPESISLSQEEKRK